MQTHKLQQGSDAWNEFRLRHHGASEAAAMLGLSLTTKRSELLQMKHTGIAKEFGDWVQKNILDHGHQVEHDALPHVESIIGDDLYPVTCSDGAISASCDGLTMARDIAFEHKQWNERIAALVAAGEVPPEHMPQCQQVLMVSKAEKLIFVVSDGTPDRMVWMWVYPDRAWFDRLRAGWAQFDADLAGYVLPAAAEPGAVGRTPETLPALRIELTGAVTTSNLSAFKDHALNVFRGINRTLVTDQHFADAEKTVKWCGFVEERLAAAKAHALSQTESIDALFRTIDEISAEARTVRLELDKLVKTRKEQRRGEIVAGGIAALRKHVEDLNLRLGKPYMPAASAVADFAGAIKGKKNFDSMQDAVDTMLANAKISANEKADLIQANLTTLRTLAAAHPFLFADAAQLVLKANDDLTALVQNRIAEHKRQEEEKEAATRERIRREEEQRAEQLARDKQAEQNRMAMSEISGIQQQVIIAELGRQGVRMGGTIECIRDTLAETEKWPIEESHFGAMTNMAQSAKDAALRDIRKLLTQAEQAAERRVAIDTEAAAQAGIAEARATAALPEPLLEALTDTAAHVRAETVSKIDAGQVIASAQRPAAAPAQATDEPGPATLLIGAINAQLEYIVNAAFLSKLGFEPARIDGARRFYLDSDLPRIGRAIAAHSIRVTQLQTA